MDGSQVRAIIRENLGWPNALTIDYVTERIIWADARLDYIAFADFDGRNMHYVITENLLHVFALTVFEDNIYWSDWEFKSVERAHKFNGMNRANVSTLVHRPMDLQVMHPHRQLPSLRADGKSMVDCSDCPEGSLCLIKPHGTDKSCVCAERHFMNMDKTKCIENCTRLGLCVLWCELCYCVHLYFLCNVACVFAARSSGVGVRTCAFPSGGNATTTGTARSAKTKRTVPRRTTATHLVCFSAMTQRVTCSATVRLPSVTE